MIKNYQGGLLMNKMKIGFIGYGSMGSMILNGLLDSNSINANDVVVSNRTTSKLDDLKAKYPEIEISEKNTDLAKKCNPLFLFVNTGEVKNVLDEINQYLIKDAHIIHISAGLSLETLEKVFPLKITQVIPSLTSEVKEGVSLVCHSEKVNSLEKKFVEDLFNHISQVNVLNEEDMDISTDLTSCSPAFMALIIKKFADFGAQRSSISEKKTEDMVLQTLKGTVKLLTDKEMTFDEVISRVATKGGITEEGVKSLEKDFPAVLENLFNNTFNKRKKLKEDLDKQYNPNWP